MPVAPKGRALMQGALESAGLRIVELEGAECMVRDAPLETSRRTTLIFRRGSPEQNRNWFASTGSLGPVAILTIEPMTRMELSFESLAEQFIDELQLRERPGEICITGGSAASFGGMLIGSMIAERAPGKTVKVAAFSLVCELHRRERGIDHFWPHMIPDFLSRPATIAGMKKYHSVRPHIVRATETPGADLRIRAFTTPLSVLDWYQASLIKDLPCVRTEDVLTDDFNHDMMSWIVLPARDPELTRNKMLQWMRARNAKWPQRTLETRVERELPAALAFRAKYPDLASVFDTM